MKTPPEGLFFDEYYRRVCGDAGPTERMSAAYRLTLVANGYLGDAVRITKRLEETRVYQLQPDALDCWLHTSGRLLQCGYLPPFTHFPVYPIWIEPPTNTAMALWDADPNVEPEKEASIIGNDAVRAIWGDHDQERPGSLRFIFLMFSGAYKALVIAPDGTWQFEQDEPCTVASCPLAREYQKERGRIPLLSTQFIRGDICPCNFVGGIWYRQLVVLSYLLSAEGAIHQQVIRNCPSRGGKRAGREKSEQVEQWKKAHPHYVTISLSTRTHGRYVTAQKNAEEQQNEVSLSAEDARGKDEATPMGQRPVGAHVRLLIPGEGLPWKKAKLILIQSFLRTPRGPLHTRYRVVS